MKTQLKIVLSAIFLIISIVALALVLALSMFLIFTDYENAQLYIIFNCVLLIVSLWISFIFLESIDKK